MKQTCQKRLARFLRDFSPENDSFQIAVLGLSALINALKNLNSTGQEAHSTLLALIAMIREARPGSFPLMHLLNFIQRDMAEGLNPALDAAAARAEMIGKIEARINQTKRCAEGLSEQGRHYLGHGDSILLLGAGEPLIRSLVLAGGDKRTTFKVIGVRVFPDQPRRLAGELKQAGLPFEQVAVEDLARYSGAIDKLFMGPMPVTPGGKIHGPKGTAQVLLNCRQKNIPIHFFADTLHYGAAEEPLSPGHGPAPARDIIDLDRMDHIITELGEVSRAGALLAVRSTPGQDLAAGADAPAARPADWPLDSMC